MAGSLLAEVVAGQIMVLMELELHQMVVAELVELLGEIEELLEQQILVEVLVVSEAMKVQVLMQVVLVLF